MDTTYDTLTIADPTTGATITHSMEQLATPQMELVYRKMQKAREENSKQKMASAQNMAPGGIIGGGSGGGGPSIHGALIGSHQGMSWPKAGQEYPNPPGTKFSVRKVANGYLVVSAGRPGFVSEEFYAADMVAVANRIVAVMAAIELDIA